MEHPQLAVRKRWTSVDSYLGPIEALLPPHNLASVSQRMERIPPLGEHTDEILAELDEEPK